MEYLGVWVTHDRGTPINRNTEAITNMKPPTPREEVQKFIGVVNYFYNI